MMNDIHPHYLYYTILFLGVYSDEDTLEQPIDVTAVAIIANGILYVALTIDPSTGHEMDQNAYGVKRVKIFTTDQSVNVMEKTVEIIPPKGSRFSLPPPPLTECREEGFVANLNYKFRGTEKAKERMHSIVISDSDDDDDSDSDDNDDDDDSDGDIAQDEDGDGDSDSSGDSEGDQDLALFLVETGNLARLPAPILRRRSLDSLTGSILGLKAATRSQGTNTSLYDTGYQSKYVLGTASKIEMKINEDESLPESSCRRIRLFDLEEVKSVTCSSSSFVLQRASDAVAFTGSLQSAITDSILDARLLVVGDTSFQWTRNAAASG